MKAGASYQRDRGGGEYCRDIWPLESSENILWMPTVAGWRVIIVHLNITLVGSYYSFDLWRLGSGIF